jgi:hypothetical protein
MGFPQVPASPLWPGRPNVRPAGAARRFSATWPKDPREEERQKQMFRELREIGWYDKEIRGPHHDQALRGWWGKEAPALVSIVTGQTPTDPAANDN